jgi:hypothetical protein
MRTRIQVGKNDTKKKKKGAEKCCFEVLDVRF